MVNDRVKYRFRVGGSPLDVHACQRLRGRAFGLGDMDVDPFDTVCTHILIEDLHGRLVACFRVLPLLDGGEITHSYASQYYELSALEAYRGKMVEMGRFCIDPNHHDPDIIRVAWAAMTSYVHDHDIDLMFGCTSFRGVDQTVYLDAFRLLKERHLGPKHWLPKVKAPRIFPFAARLRKRPDMKEAMRRMPPLLKSYLMMGGWVSDHAVIDDQMNTIHVFTGVEIAAIPPARKRLLQLAAQTGI